MPIGNRTVLAYAMPALALSVPTLPVFVLLPTFYAESVGLGLTVTGAVFLAARLFDGVTDPIAGWLSDRTPSRWGRRKPWILCGGIIAGIALLFLLQPSEAAGWAYLLFWAVVLYAGWTLVSVPYIALGAELSDQYHERSRVTGARETATLIGILAAAAVPPMVAAHGGDQSDGLAAIAWITVGLGAAAIALLLRFVPDRPHDAEPKAAMAWREAAQAFVRNGPFQRLLAAWFVNGLANGVPAVLFPLYLRHGLGVDEGTTGLLIGLYFLAGIAAIPVWLRLSRRWGKHRAWCAAMMLACAAFVWVPVLSVLHLDAVVAFAAVCVLTGAALGADLALPPALQADVVDYDTLRTGKRRAGLFFAVWNLATKVALALAVGMAFPALDAVGFDSGSANGTGTLFALAVIYAWVPCVFKLSAIAIVWRHPITERRHRIIRKRIESVRQFRDGTQPAAGTRS